MRLVHSPVCPVYSSYTMHITNDQQKYLQCNVTERWYEKMNTYYSHNVKSPEMLTSTNSMWLNFL